MASRPIDYIWKVARPKNEAIARALMYAAYKTAMETDPNTTRVLIRSYIHPSTFDNGVHRPDDPHITVFIKTRDMEETGQHLTSH